MQTVINSDMHIYIYIYTYHQSLTPGFLFYVVQALWKSDLEGELPGAELQFEVGEEIASYIYVHMYIYITIYIYTYN